MVDHLSPQKRSECMSKIRGKNTTPEKITKAIIDDIGYKYRMYDSKLSGKPDFVFPRLKKVVFVHGCFWHMHSCKHFPRSHKKYWKNKLENNIKRDRRILRQLRKQGWKVLVIWECWTKKRVYLTKKIKTFLKPKI